MSMKICDAHLHYGLRPVMEQIVNTSPLAQKFPCYSMTQFDSMDRYEALFAEHDVDCTVLVPFVFREVSIPEENAVVLEFARKDPEHRFPYAILDESDPGFIGRHYRDYVGVKEHIILNESILTDEKRIIFEQVRDHGLTFLLHSQLLRREEYVTQLLKEFPGIKIQIAHMGRGKPGDISVIRQIMEAFRSYENVTFDTSTTREPEVVEWAVDTVGADRILYASDLPFYMEDGEDIMAAQIRQVLDARISDDQREAIFCKNFHHWIKRGV